MSTQQILGVVGGVVGAFFGYPQLGFVVGSLVGGLLTPAEKIEGPRVDDLKVQVSTYGAGIPILYGTERIGGNVVWSTDKIEIADTQGGKGAPPEQTTYRYFVHMGIVLCETPRDGSIVSLAQIFQDGKLIYDARSGIPIGSALASAENPNAYFVLYQGHADQLPDPGEEAWMGGPGSVPAYRGVVRIRMNAIECPGGRVPQFSFVLSTTAQTVVDIDDLADAPGGVTSYHGMYVGDGVWHTNFVDNDADGNGDLEVYYGQSGALPLVRTIPLAFSAFGALTTFTPIPCPGSGEPIWLRTRTEANGTDTAIDEINVSTGVQKPILTYTKGASDFPYLSSSYATCAYDPLSEKYVMLGGGSIAQQTQPAVIYQGTVVVCAPLIGATPGPVSIYDDIVYVVTLDSGIIYFERRNATTGAVIGSPVAGPSLGSAAFAQVAIYSSAAGTFVCIPSSFGVDSRFYQIGLSWTHLYTENIYEQFPFASANFYCDGKISIVGPSNTDRKYQILRSAVVTNEIKVADIISDQCDRAGEPRYDISAIPDEDTVIGFKLQNPASARSNVDPLLTAFAIYIVDEDGLIKFKKYEDINSAATIGYDELGQAEDGAEAADAMPLSRAQEVDLPRSVSVSYIEPAIDYQTASEKEVRQITDSNEDMIVELPMATTSNHAKQVASMILFARWRAQNTRSFKTSRKYAFLSPGDGVTVEYPRGTSRLWRITSMTDTGVLCEFNVEPGDAELYTQTAVGATGYVGQEVAPLAPPTRLQLLDIPILRDVDNNAGLYAAMAGFASGWPGAELFVGDDDTNLESRGVVQNEAPIGIAETALGNWTLGVIDETNLLTVNVTHHLLSSITQDVLLTGTQNVIALGAPGRWEILKFQRADDLGGGRYILSGFLRGQRGTEWARNLHRVNDTFVLLSMAGVLRPNLEAGSIGQTKAYRAVTKGRSLNSASSQGYANTAEGLETFSPTNLTKTLSSGNLVFDWVRRTRLSENWLSGIVPLGEAQERYEFVIYTNSTYATERRVITSSTRTATYTAAMQTEDGYAGGTLYVRVFQLSDVVGRGHALEAAI